MEFNAVEPGRHGVAGTTGEVLNARLDFVDSECVVLGRRRAIGLDRTWAADLMWTILLAREDFWRRPAAQVPQLEKYERALCVDGIGNFAPCGYVLGAPDSGDIVHASCTRAYYGRLCDQQSSRSRGALRVVFCAHVHLYMVLVGTESGERGENDAMGQRRWSQLDGGEQAILFGHGVRSDFEMKENEAVGAHSVTPGTYSIALLSKLFFDYKSRRRFGFL